MKVDGHEFLKSCFWQRDVFFSMLKEPSILQIIFCSWFWSLSSLWLQTCSLFFASLGGDLKWPTYDSSGWFLVSDIRLLFFLFESSTPSTNSETFNLCNVLCEGTRPFVCRESAFLFPVATWSSVRRFTNWWAKPERSEACRTNTVLVGRLWLFRPCHKAISYHVLSVFSRWNILFDEQRLATWSAGSQLDTPWCLTWQWETDVFPILKLEDFSISMLVYILHWVLRVLFSSLTGTPSKTCFLWKWSFSLTIVIREYHHSRPQDSSDQQTSQQKSLIKDGGNSTKNTFNQKTGTFELNIPNCI